MFQHREDSARWLHIAASFAVGAMLTWLAAEAIERRRRLPAPVGDDVLRERIAQRIAQVVSDPGGVHVAVEDGVVRLTGALPPEERDELLTQLVTMPGVMRLRNALAVSS
jgi:osmotically-inducible protein OsmY